MRRLPLLAFAAIAAVWAIPTQADAPLVVEGAPMDEFSTRVPFGDLQLATDSGIRELRRRVWQASVEVCDAYEKVAGPPSLATPPCAAMTYRAARPQVTAAISQARDGNTLALASIRIRLSR